MTATAYQDTLTRQGPYIRGSEEWRARENARAAKGCACINHDPIPQGQARGELNAYRQQVNTEHWLPGVRADIAKRRAGK